MLSISTEESPLEQRLHQRYSDLNFISVYQTSQGIEVRPGCEDYMNSRLVGSFVSYEQAIETATRVADQKHLPLFNYAESSRDDELVQPRNHRY